MSFSLESAVPELMRRIIEFGERTAPPIPEMTPDVVAAGPAREGREPFARLKGPRT